MVLSSAFVSCENRASSVPLGRKPVLFPEISSTCATNSGYSARLAFPSGTITIIPGLSGAGERIPALAHDASWPGCWRSKIRQRSPGCASSSAMAPPINPPPAMTASNFFIQSSYSIQPRASFAANIQIREQRSNGSVSERNHGLQGIGEFLGQYLRLFGKASSPAPVRDLRCFSRVLDEPSDLGDQVRLCLIQIFSARRL